MELARILEFWLNTKELNNFMNFFELVSINKNEKVKKYIDKLKKNNDLGIKYEFIDKIEKVLKYLENNKIQLEIIKNKIKKVSSVSLFFDFLVELHF